MIYTLKAEYFQSCFSKAIVNQPESEGVVEKPCLENVKNTACYTQKREGVTNNKL